MDKILLAGISGLANTKARFKYPWFFAHSGASVLAAYFMLEENNFDPKVEILIRNQISKMVDGDDPIFSSVSTSERTEDINDFLKVLAECAAIHSTTGHGVIFGTLALKAILREPDLLTEYVLHGLIALLRDCMNDVPNRHYGIPDYHAPDVDYSRINRISSIQDVARHSLHVHDAVYPDQMIDDTFYFLAGDLLHCVTYAHALLELDGLGYTTISADGLEPLQEHIFLSSRKHKDLQPFTTNSYVHPLQPSFWEREKTEPHHIKLAYSSLALSKDMSAEERESLFENLSKYWELYD